MKKKKKKKNIKWRKNIKQLGISQPSRIKKIHNKERARASALHSLNHETHLFYIETKFGSKHI